MVLCSRDLNLRNLKMGRKKYFDEELMKILDVDKKILDRFKEIQKATIEEAKNLDEKWMKRKKIKVLGISGSARDENDMAQESSNSEEMLKVCLDECKKLGAETELLSLRKYDIKYCKACYSTCNTQCHFYCSCYPKGKEGDDMTNILYDKILGADAIIFATPVNDMSVSTLMKTFIDRCISLDGSLMPANPQVPKDKELNRKHMKFIELMADNDVWGSGMLKRFMGKVAGIITTGHEEGASMAISQLFMTLNHWGMIFPPISSTYANSSICNSTYEDKPLVVNECHKKLVRELAENVFIMTKMAKGIKISKWKYEYEEN
jgi:multimeric flavodoxin WrbA